MFLLTYEAEELGCYGQIIPAERRTNDNMEKYVTINAMKNLIKANVSPQSAKRYEFKISGGQKTHIKEFL